MPPQVAFDGNSAESDGAGCLLALLQIALDAAVRETLGMTERRH